MIAQKTPVSPAKSTFMRLLRFMVLGLLGLGLALGALYLAGPRNSFGPDTPSVREQPPRDPGALDAWLRQSESAYADLKPGNAKGISWARSPGQRTAWAVVYLHGYSASRLETAPLAERLGQALGANVFHTRLSGHGRASVAAMGDASVQDWLADATEALRIGRTLGNKVLVLGVSTGATLATWLTLQPEGKDIAALVFVSPNYGPKDPKADLVNGPWGREIALAIEGETRGWTPKDEREANAWSTRHATRALFPMMALVKQVRESALESLQTPVLMLYSEGDQTVSPAQTKAAFARMGSPRKTLQAVDYSSSHGQHVLAGDITAPDAVAPMSASIVQWVKDLPQ
ncbi:MAG: alpha/beta hydrolase [Rhodoferax sp.]